MISKHYAPEEMPPEFCGMSESKDTTSATTSAAKEALSSGAQGAAVGSMFGPEGAVIGFVGGAVLGGIAGFFSNKAQSEINQEQYDRMLAEAQRVQRKEAARVRAQQRLKAVKAKLSYLDPGFAQALPTSIESTTVKQPIKPSDTPMWASILSGSVAGANLAQSGLKTAATIKYLNSLS